MQGLSPRHRHPQGTACRLLHLWPQRGRCRSPGGTGFGGRLCSGRGSSHRGRRGHCRLPWPAQGCLHSAPLGSHCSWSPLSPPRTSSPHRTAQSRHWWVAPGWHHRCLLGTAWDPQMPRGSRIPRGTARCTLRCSTQQCFQSSPRGRLWSLRRWRLQGSRIQGCTAHCRLQRPIPWSRHRFPQGRGYSFPQWRLQGKSSPLGKGHCTLHQLAPARTQTSHQGRHWHQCALMLRGSSTPHCMHHHRQRW